MRFHRMFTKKDDKTVDIIMCKCYSTYRTKKEMKGEMFYVETKYFRRKFI